MICSGLHPWKQSGSLRPVGALGSLSNLQRSLRHPTLECRHSWKKDMNWRMICYINAIQTAGWKHYQLSSWRSCCAVKLVWNWTTLRKNGKMFSLLINVTRRSLPVLPLRLIIEIFEREIQNSWRRWWGPRLLSRLARGLWVQRWGPCRLRQEGSRSQLTTQEHIFSKSLVAAKMPSART